jgi:hypothetical protein
MARIKTKPVNKEINAFVAQYPDLGPTALADLINDVFRKQLEEVNAFPMSRDAAKSRRDRIQGKKFKSQGGHNAYDEFTIEKPPQGYKPDLKKLKERRRKQFEERHAYEEARKLIPVKIKIDGPIGLVFFGDPHIDDPGCDFPRLERDLGIVRRTQGMFGGNVGDMHNNWIGRLTQLYGKQETTEIEAWALVEWMINEINWLFLIAGNHDMWSGSGNPMTWMADKKTGVYEEWSVRMRLDFPNGKEVRINAKHDFPGHSMYNPAHGVARAAMLGWRDHILVCGDKHTTAYQLVQDPAEGLISHAIRCGSYKMHDDYVKVKGFKIQNFAPAVAVIIDPQYEDNDPRLISTFFDVERAADYLEFIRGDK